MCLSQFSYRCIDDTLEKNIAFKIPDHLIDHQRLQNALRAAQLDEAVERFNCHILSAFNMSIPKSFSSLPLMKVRQTTLIFRIWLSISLRGCNKLGIEHYASNNYWQLSPEGGFLLTSNPDAIHHDCDVVVIERQWYEKYGCFPADLFALNRQYKTYCLYSYVGSVNR